MKNKIYFIKILVLILLLIAIIGLFRVVTYKEEIKYSGDNLYEWFENKFINKEKLIVNKIGEKEDILYLSESQGLYLLYLLEKDDKDEFYDVYKNTKKYFYSEGLFKWEIKATSNALLDDLRIIKALIYANKKWKFEYDKEINDLMYGLEIKNSVLDKVVSFADIQNNERPNYIDLSFLDLEAIDEISKINPKWNKMKIESQELLESNISQPFFIKYDYLEGFVRTEEFHMAEYLYLLINQNYFINNQEAIKWIISSYNSDGFLSGSYSYKGESLGNVESAAVYALAARYMYINNEFDWAYIFLDKSKALLDDSIYKYDSGYKKEVYAFDILEFLLALEEVN